MGHALASEVPARLVLPVATPVVLDRSPALGFDMVLEFLKVLVDAEPDDADLVTPVLASFVEHRLVVGHRCLARRAPRGPEIEEKDLTWHMLDVAHFFGLVVDLGVVFDGAHRVALPDGAFNAVPYFHITCCCIDFLI
jgi:hypothetical protein